MGDSYRIKTELGINKSINIQLDQDFDFLEILSLKIQQGDIYTRNCADYGVLVGRVTANNGFGLPNARVSIFIPIDGVDESNPLISSIYPYKSPTDKNEDGYRYNLLPYVPSYSKHAATGTLPSRTDVLTESTAVEIYDKYYRYTTRTNDSGDYMIMGVPLGDQTVVMDVDLSDIGEFSLTPQDLIRMGLATENQVAGGKFITSNDLNSLPQIINLTKNAEISPLWGDPEVCQISVNRLDFDLRDDANVDIQPTAVFMGSMFSSPDNMRVRNNCRPKDDLGNLCQLTTGPGQILAIRQTINQDGEGNPILEVFELEQSGNVIDGSGTWITEIPMNLDYYVTNEFGEKVLSNDPTIGIPTKSKYRFKVKWEQPNDLTIQTRRAYYLVPNVKEYGWGSSTQSPNTVSEIKQQESSYYFGLDWSGYTNGFTSTRKTERLNEIINCDDTFYEFKYNRVYTVSSLIDQYKKGAKGRFIGIKEIDDNSCESGVNKFPVNDGFRNFDLLFFLFSIIFTILQPIGLIVLTLAHILIWLYNIIIQALCWLCDIKIPVINVKPFGFICRRLGISCDRKDYTIRLPMITYPNCQACDCKQELKTSRNEGQNTLGNGVLTQLSSPDNYYNLLSEVYFSGENMDNLITYSTIFSETLGGLSLQNYVNNPNRYKLPLSQTINNKLAYSYSLPIGERINIFNQRDNFFTGKNKIKVTFAKNSNFGKYHYDNTLTVLSQDGFSSGDLLTFVNITGSTDKNYLYTASTTNGIITGISGETYNGSGQTQIQVSYATSQTSNIVTPVVYNLPYGSTETNYKFPADVEYYQVITALTVSQASAIWNTGTTESFGNILNSPSVIKWSGGQDKTISPYEFFEAGEDQYILVLQRGVDPYSPKYVNEYSIGEIFGTNENDVNWTFTAETRLNIPIQKLNVTNMSVQPYSQQDMYYQSYFFKPGTTELDIPGQSFTGYTTVNTAYYGSLDATTTILPVGATINGGTPSKVTSRVDNYFYSNTISSSKYDNSEDLSGMGIMNAIDVTSTVNYEESTNLLYQYTSKTFFSTTPQLTISSPTLNVLRTDRLPSSDGLDGNSFNSNAALLQQNNNFSIYQINTDSDDISSVAFTTGAEIPTADIEGIANYTSVLSSFECENMVGLDCYKGFGDTFEIDQTCVTKDAVDKGCYMFMRRPLTDLGKDLDNFAEWGFRFRFFYGLCRGVLSQSFMNNWINGALYAFPIQVDTYYNNQNKVSKTKYCQDVIYFDKNTNNFYYRSTPYNDITNKFVGKKSTQDGAINKVNLLYPTTIINLGMKDNFYSEITFDPTTKGYILSNLSPTSYGDTSDLVNLFVISRITDEKFLSQLIPLGDNSLNQLFSRDYKRIDGDLAQLMSINSEIGNINFSPEYYEIISGTTNQSTTILGAASDPTIAVWFSSTTEDLQVKDYLTPGRINFRGSNNVGYYPYSYGIKSQVVPFYQWRLDNLTTIFGNQKNTWATEESDIIQNMRYQSLERYSSDTPYFWGNNSQSNDLNARGYIFNMNGTVGDGTYLKTGAIKQKFLVGAPFQFYFGVVKGETALDKFKRKYSINE